MPGYLSGQDSFFPDIFEIFKKSIIGVNDLQLLVDQGGTYIHVVQKTVKIVGEPAAVLIVLIINGGNDICGILQCPHIILREVGVILSPEYAQNTDGFFLITQNQDQMVPEVFFQQSCPVMGGTFFGGYGEQ